MAQPFVDAGKLKVLAIAQEQHAERTRLYQQWKQLDWQILQDPICEQGIKAVPMAIAINEDGTVASLRVKEQWLASWVEEDAEGVAPKPSNSIQLVSGSDERKKLVATADKLVKFSDELDAIDKAVEAYEEAIALQETAPVRFRLGVALRKRFDLFGKEEDFRLAEQNWTRSLELDPTQYIFRRRIEQYGPRLNKPYPFYDWVETAIKEVKERGDSPIELSVKLSGAEIAGRTRNFGGVEGQVKSPDPDDRLEQDKEIIAITSLCVPGKIAPGKSARIHLALEPSAVGKWNNESSPPLVWIEPPEGVEVTHRLIKLEQPQQATSQETRRTELEIKLPSTYSGPTRIPAYALYNVCRNDDGVCKYARQDFDIEFELIGD